MSVAVSRVTESHQRLCRLQNSVAVVKLLCIGSIVTASLSSGQHKRCNDIKMDNKNDIYTNDKNGYYSIWSQLQYTGRYRILVSE